MTLLIQHLVEEDFGYNKGAGIWGRSEKHDSLVVNEKTQKWFWNSIGLRGGVLDYLIQIRKFSKNQALDLLKSSHFALTAENTTEENNSKPYDKLVELLWRSGEHDRDYWYHRKLTDSTIDKYRLGALQGWYFIPIYVDGEFSNFQCRRDYPTRRMKRWYKDTPTVLYNDGILPFVDTVFILEGTVDAILLSQEGFPCVATMGANVWLPEWNSKFTHIKNIFYVEDNDKAGRSGARLISKSLGMERVKIVSFSGEEEKFDVVDFFRSDKTASDFREYVKSTSQYLYEIEDVIYKKKWSYSGRKGRTEKAV